MALIRSLTDVDVPGTEPKRPRNRLLLVVEVAGEIEMHVVLADLRLLARDEAEPEPGVVTGQQREAAAGVVGHLPAGHSRPKPRDLTRIIGIEAQRHEVRGHFAP